MKKTSWIVLGVILALLGLLLYTKIAPGPMLSDEEQIHQLLSDAQSAVERRDVRAAMALIASDYRDTAGNNHDRLEALAIRAFRGNERFTVTLKNKGMNVRDGSATVNLNVTVGAIVRRSNTIEELFFSPITLEMKKKSSRRWLIFPTQEWLITSITNLPSGYMDM